VQSVTMSVQAINQIVEGFCATRWIDRPPVDPLLQAEEEMDLAKTNTAPDGDASVDQLLEMSKDGISTADAICHFLPRRRGLSLRPIERDIESSLPYP
jgi:hypothetical protein